MLDWFEYVTEAVRQQRFDTVIVALASDTNLMNWMGAGAWVPR